jgi:hypothetical protein
MRNPVRWIEYACSASLMHVQIAILSGCTDIHVLVCIFGLTAVTMLFGLLSEQHRSTTAYWCGFVPHTVQWLVVMCFFATAAVRGSPPLFVWFIMCGIFVADSSFAYVMFRQHRGGWSYVRVEFAYCLLSLLAKQFLAWTTFVGSVA